MSDEKPDLSDAPELPEALWLEQGERGRFYRPVKQQITIRIDADLLAWFKARGGKYQAHINAALRQYVKDEDLGRV